MTRPRPLLGQRQTNKNKNCVRSNRRGRACTRFELLCEHLTLLLTVQITLHGQKAVHFANLRGVLHPFHQLLHLLASALIVVSRLQAQTRRHLRISPTPD